MNISSTINYNGQEVTFIWIPTENIGKYQPIKNIAGICLNDKQGALICRETADEGWKLPGGRPEKNETPAQTLKRELVEEVAIKVDFIKLIGTQKVDFPNNPKVSEGDLFYQVRYFCKIKEVLPQTNDPDTGVLYDRKFVPIIKLNNYLKWGKIGDAIVARVIEINNQFPEKNIVKLIKRKQEE